MAPLDIKIAEVHWKHSQNAPDPLRIGLENKAKEIAHDLGRKQVLEGTENPFTVEELQIAWENGKNSALPIVGLLNTGTEEIEVPVTNINAHKVKCFGHGWVDTSKVRKIS